MPKDVILSLFGGEEMARRRGQRKGHLFKKSGSWYLRYRVDTPELDESGKLKRERVTVQVAAAEGPGSVSKREAQRIAWTDYLSKLDASSTRPSSMKTLREFVETRWLPDVVETLKPKTQQFYGTMLNHILPELGEVALREINAARVQAFLNAKAKTGLTRTVDALKVCLSAILRHARSMQWYAGELPTDTVRTPQRRPKEKQALSWEQACALSRALPEPVGTLTLLLTLTGLRIGEAMALRIRSLNPTDQYLTTKDGVIPPLAISIRENFVLGRYQTLKTSRSYRDVPVPVWFWPRLVALLERAEWTGPDCPVFVSSAGTPLDHHNVANRVLKPAAKSLGMPWVSWHVFRHTAASLADQAGMTIAERQKLLGHNSAAIALHYTHADMESMRGHQDMMADPSKMVQ